MTPAVAWKRAVQIVGTKAKLARAIGVSPQRLGRWKECPAEFALKVETAVADAFSRRSRPVDRTDLRPDIYPPKKARP